MFINIRIDASSLTFNEFLDVDDHFLIYLMTYHFVCISCRKSSKRNDRNTRRDLSLIVGVIFLRKPTKFIWCVNESLSYESMLMKNHEDMTWLNQIN